MQEAQGGGLFGGAHRAGLGDDGVGALYGNLKGEERGVVRALAGEDPVGGRGLALGGGPLLKFGLGIGGGGIVRLGQQRRPEIKDDGGGLFQPSLNIEGGDDRFAGVGDDGLVIAGAAPAFAAGQAQRLAQPQVAGNPGAGLAVDEAVEAFGEIAGARLAVKGHQMIGDDEAQDPVAQEFQTLIVQRFANAGPGADAGVGQGPLQKGAIGEDVAQAGLKRGDGVKTPIHRQAYASSGPII